MPRGGGTTDRLRTISPVPIITALIAVGEWYALRLRQHELMPFLGAIGLFLMSFIGIAISLWPMIVPYHYTLWQAASSASTQAFMLIGTLFLLPVILMYTAWSYWVFRGKVSEFWGRTSCHCEARSAVQHVATLSSLGNSRSRCRNYFKRSYSWTRQPMALGQDVRAENVLAAVTCQCVCCHASSDRSTPAPSAIAMKR